MQSVSEPSSGRRLLDNQTDNRLSSGSQHFGGFSSTNGKWIFIQDCIESCKLTIEALENNNNNNKQTH